MKNEGSLGKGALTYEVMSFCIHLLHLHTSFHLQSSKGLILTSGALMKFPCAANRAGIVISSSRMGKQGQREV